MIRIITDSAADIPLEEANDLNIHIVPLHTTFGTHEIKQETIEDYNQFYKELMTTDVLPITSRPSPDAYSFYFKEAEEKGEDVLVLALSSGLSGTYESAVLARNLSPYKENIVVIDTQQAILSQRMLVEHAVQLRDAGATLDKIVDSVNDVKERMVVCGLIDTLKYLKMGGRIPKTLAVLGEALKIKPLILLEDGVLTESGKKRGRAAGKKHLQKELDHVRLDPTFPVYFGYTLNQKEGQCFMEETKTAYTLSNVNLFPIGGVIGTHVGPEALAIAFVKEK